MLIAIQFCLYSVKLDIALMLFEGELWWIVVDISMFLWNAGKGEERWITYAGLPYFLQADIKAIIDVIYDQVVFFFKERSYFRFSGIHSFFQESQLQSSNTRIKKLWSCSGFLKDVNCKDCLYLKWPFTSLSVNI